MGSGNALREGLEPCAGFRLTRLLGKGSHGEVWEAATERGATLGLKFIPAESGLATPREIKAIQSLRLLRHPHLVRLDQVWTMPGYLVVAMELCEGTLADLRFAYQSEYGTSIPSNIACEYLTQVASALDFLNTRQHRIDGQVAGVQHGGVKGSNLLLFGDTVKVSDFEQSSLTSVPAPLLPQLSGLQYAAPEVFEGYLSAQSDQHALAVTYCELRGGRLPFPPLTEFRKSWPQRRPAPDLSMLPPAEQPVIARALDRVPQNRWPSCSDLMQALDRAARSELLASAMQTS